MSKLFDSHCHPQFPQYDDDRGAMLVRALDAGVSMICVGTDLKTSKSGIELAQQYEGMWATVGLHPNDNLGERFDAGQYRELLKQPKVVAMGEIGLDYYRTENSKDQQIQKERFIQQLECAKEMKMPLVLHCRDGKTGSTGPAYRDMTEILKAGYAIHGGVVHSFTGSLDEVKKFLDLGLYIGFNGIITFARQYDDVVRYVPLDRILLETDAPYLTPEPHRGKRNEPLHVDNILDKLCELRGERVDKAGEITTSNCKYLFKLD